MKYTVIARTLFDDGKNPYYQILLSSYPFPKQLGNTHAEELSILRPEADDQSSVVSHQSDRKQITENREPS